MACLMNRVFGAFHTRQKEGEEGGSENSEGAIWAGFPITVPNEVEVFVFVSRSICLLLCLIARPDI